MRIHRCARREDYFDLVNSAEFNERWMLESHLASRLADRSRFSLPGICAACMQAVDFAGDFTGAWTSPDGLRVPNWRECLVCPACSLNGRQRSTARQTMETILGSDRRDGFRLYTMEQLSPLYAWLRRTFPWVECVGSEYLGDGIAGGTLRNDLRHEDAEALSFPSGHFDAVVSCDVLEHVNEPARALAEIVRVLRPGGHALLTFPMDPHLDRNQRRATVGPLGVEHLAPAIYHGNPLSAAGSLVITDFGWQVLEQMRDAGMTDAALHVYWSYQHGYLGIQFFFRGTAPLV
jgi:hypothetical protein